MSLAAFLLLPALALRLDPGNYAGGPSRDAGESQRRNSSSVAIMLGELRTSMGDILFIKTERYLDSGIAYVPHEKKGVNSLTEETEHLEEHEEEAREHAADHEEDRRLGVARRDGELQVVDDPEHYEKDEEAAGTATIIRTAAEDFRGFIGYLQREVKPWRDPSQPHMHTPGTELLPWYRMMTMADPHNVRGYAVGGWWLKGLDPDQAMQFVEEGLRFNPEAFQLHYMKGQIYFRRFDLHIRGGGDPEDPGARLNLAKALEWYTRAAELGLAQRPKGYVYGSRKDVAEDYLDYQEEDVRACARLAVFLETRAGDPAKAVAMARQYLTVLGEDGILERYIQEHPPG